MVSILGRPMEAGDESTAYNHSGVNLRGKVDCVQRGKIDIIRDFVHLPSVLGC